MTRSSRFLSNMAAPPPEAVAVESDMVVILAALLCALICVVGLFAVARCTCFRRRRDVDGNQNNNSGQGLANKGIKKKVLQSLPKVVYTKDGGGIENFATVDCAICLVEFGEGDEIRVLPQCGHGFHVCCIDPWLASHSSCPSCRQIFVVGRCQKCGLFPAVSESGNEAQRKAREDNPNPAVHGSDTFLP